MRDYEFYYTQDGSIGLYSHTDEDVYHSKYGAITEAWEKFILPLDIDKRINTVKDIKVLDVCYGIGYNTKALMTYVLNKNKKYLKQKNIFQKIILKIKKIKKNNITNNIETIHIDNTNQNLDDLSTHIETIQKEMLSKFTIDCLDINEEIIKISPFLKTVITPQEIFVRIVPKIFDCFESYWKIKRALSRLSLKIANRNKKLVMEILNLKFNDEIEPFNEDFKCHDFVNYILIDNLEKHYNNKLVDNNLKKLLLKKENSSYMNAHMIKYAKYKQSFRYKIISKLNLIGFLHNIYYDHLSKRYIKSNYYSASKLFKVNFHIDDARKAILNINQQYDYIFLDAFTYSKTPELWSLEFIAELYRRLAPNGILITYSNSALVRNTLIENNFHVGKILNKDNKSIGTVAAKDKSMIKNPLSSYEYGLCTTRAGIPYRDPNLNRDKKLILECREYDFKNSDLLTSSQYLKQRVHSKEDT